MRIDRIFNLRINHIFVKCKVCRFVKLQDKKRRIYDYDSSYDEKVYLPLHIILIKIDLDKSKKYVLDDVIIHWGVTTKDSLLWNIPSKYWSSTDTIFYKDALCTKINKESLETQIEIVGNFEQFKFKFIEMDESDTECDHKYDSVITLRTYKKPQPKVTKINAEELFKNSHDLFKSQQLPYYSNQ